MQAEQELIETNRAQVVANLATTRCRGLPGNHEAAFEAPQNAADRGFLLE